MDFSKLEVIIIDTEIYNNKPNILIHKGNIPLIEKTSIIPEGKYKLDFNKDVLKKAPKLTKEQLKLAEPGNKIPVSTFQQIGKWCEECNDTEAHVHDPSRKKFRCLKCKTIKYYK